MGQAVQDIFLSPLTYARRAGCGAYEALRHYEEVGWRSGLDPHPLFDTAYVLRRYGAALPGRSPFEIYRAVARHQAPVTNGFFQVEWYLAANADIRGAVVDPIEHYVLTGVTEGRQPNPWYAMRQPSQPAAEFWAGVATFDDYVASLDEAGRIDTDWLTEALGLPAGSAHQMLWRDRHARPPCWPVSPELLLGSIRAENFPAPDAFSAALERCLALRPDAGRKAAA